MVRQFADCAGQRPAVAALVGNPDLEAAFKGQIDELAQQVKSLRPIRRPTKRGRSPTISLAGNRPASAGTGPRGSQRFSLPNFHAQLGGELLGMAVGGPIDDVAPIDDVILGTVIHGTGHTVGQTKALLTPESHVCHLRRAAGRGQL